MLNLSPTALILLYSWNAMPIGWLFPLLLGKN
jgi:hypothetical protein